MDINQAIAGIGLRFVDRAGNPIGFFDWVLHRAEESYVRVGLDTVGEYQISTVWLGTSHHSRPGAFEPFETMVFRNGEVCFSGRYETESQAVAGHAFWRNYYEHG